MGTKKKKVIKKKSALLKKVKKFVKKVKKALTPKVALTVEKDGYSGLGQSAPDGRAYGDPHLRQIMQGDVVLAEAYVQKRGWLWIEVRKIKTKEGITLPAKAEALAKLLDEARAYAREEKRLLVVGTAAKEPWLASAFAKNGFKLVQLVKNPSSGNLVSVYLIKA